MKTCRLLPALLLAGSLLPTSLAAQTTGAPTLTFDHPQPALTDAYTAALQNLLTVNTIPYTSGGKQAEYNQTGLLAAAPDTFIRAGGGYEQPWTRDASVNSWNAGSLLEPAVARNTLLAVLKRQPNGKLIIQQDNQWWDQVIWVTAAWNHFLLTGDRPFLANAFQAATETLGHNRQTHFNPIYQLFEGPAFLNDGIAGYPVPPANPTESRGSFVLAYPGADKIMVLSTNCLYVAAFHAAAQMASALARPPAERARLQASGDALAEQIRQRFWLPASGRFGYILFPDGHHDDSQEGAGLAFSVLFGVATPPQTAAILRSIHLDPHGLVDVFPVFPRYSTEHPGRHNNIVWPPIQGFWAEAAARSGDSLALAQQTDGLVNLVAGNGGHFWEIYNAETGKPDGGWQVNHQWDSQPDQTWSATGYLGMIYTGLFGLRPEPAGLRFTPTLPSGWGPVTLSGVRYRRATLTIRLLGEGTAVRAFKLDGKPVLDQRVSANLDGAHEVVIELRTTSAGT